MTRTPTQRHTPLTHDKPLRAKTTQSSQRTDKDEPRRE